MKYTTHNNQMRHKGRNFRINSKVSGIHTETMHRLIDQLDICILKWGRVFVYRFDLHQGSYTPNNQRLALFRKRLSRRLLSEYGIHEYGFVWAREQEKAKAQHYHFAIFVDGDLIQHSGKLKHLIRESWERLDGDHIPTIKNPFYNVVDDSSMADVIYRLSYLAKARGKGYRYRPDQTRPKIIQPAGYYRGLKMNSLPPSPPLFIAILLLYCDNIFFSESCPLFCPL